MVRGVKLRSRSSSSMRSRSAVMYTSFKVSITVLTHRRYSTCRASGLVQIAASLIDSDGAVGNPTAKTTTWFVLTLHETQCSVPKTLSIQSMEAIESIPQPLQVFGLPQTLVYGTGVFKPGEEP